MPRQRKAKRHLGNFARRTTVCGRRADPADLVATVLEADCRVCSTEFARWATNLSELTEIAGPACSRRSWPRPLERRSPEFQKRTFGR